ncbi:P-loop containing nucleoside triphosphate hydrolase protein [Xylaria digitata]|nr:P-loop containing nucleoside triphosphate hydrolase protein [Xylaria digitata]
MQVLKRKASRRSYRPESVSPSPSNRSRLSGTIVPSSPSIRPPSTTNSRKKAISDSDDQSSTRSQSHGVEAEGLGSFTPPPFTDIGKKLKECNDTLGDLQSLGVSHVAVLPELVLVGDQSSGKSSLMSALTRLNLPTSSGICTRCPFHIRMSSSKDPHFSCTVSLQMEYDYVPHANHVIGQSNVTKRNPFPTWKPKPVTETIVFKTIYGKDPNDIGEILRWAQVAILNPSQNPEQFVPGEGSYAKETALEIAKRSTEARFSPNVVSLQMRGLESPDLSMFDLPGVFAVAEAKDEDYLVDVVENLTRKYVARKGAIIMLALPMDHDIENSRTLKVIRELNAEDRTIGVLTKADRPNFKISDIITYWLAVLDEKKQKVKKDSFYITSLPPNEVLDNPAEWEASFFRAGAENWPADFSRFMHRCGVDQLRDHITKELGDSFSLSLPYIKEKFKSRLEEIECHLNELPDLPSNVEHEVRMCLKDFYTSVKRAVDLQDFEEGCKELNEEFHLSLVKMKPKCIMVTEKPKQRPLVYSEEIVIVSDDSGNEATGCKRPVPRSSTIDSTPKRLRYSEPFTPIKAEDGSPAGTNLRPSVTPVPCSLRTSEGKFFKISLLEIQKSIKHKTRGGFGDVIPLVVHETLCLQAVSQWEQPLQNYIEKATDMLTKAVTNALESSLNKFSKRLIYKESSKLLRVFLKDQAVRQRGRLKELYKNETYKAVTINEVGLNHFKAKEKELLERHRLFIRLKTAGFIDSDIQFKLDEESSREEMAEQCRLLDKHRSQLPEDEFKRELDVAATVRGYYLTAATRFVDGVSMDINSWLFRSFRDGVLDEYLDEKLGLFPYPTPETYEKLMSEDPKTKQKRERLRKERDKLWTAMERISELERSFTDSGTLRSDDRASEHNGKMET